MNIELEERESVCVCWVTDLFHTIYVHGAIYTHICALKLNEKNLVMPGMLHIPLVKLDNSVTFPRLKIWVILPSLFAFPGQSISPIDFSLQYASYLSSIFQNPRTSFITSCPDDCNRLLSVLLSLVVLSATKPLPPSSQSYLPEAKLWRCHFLAHNLSVVYQCLQISNSSCYSRCSWPVPNLLSCPLFSSLTLLLTCTVQLT